VLEAGENAFASLHAAFCFEIDGAAKTQAGVLTASLVRDGTAWKIAGFSFLSIILGGARGCFLTPAPEAKLSVVMAAEHVDNGGHGCGDAQVRR
jgi:hypothetical protein